MRNIKTYLNRIDPPFDPTIKLKYAEGLGDFISWFLHSKPIGLITYLITGELAPCSKCNNRRLALNILFPIPFWKMFFKSVEMYNISLKSDYENSGIVFLKDEEIENVIEKEVVEEKIVITMYDMIKNSQT